MNSILTLAEVAIYLKLSEKTVLKMIKNHEIPCAKIANQWRFSREIIDSWLMSKMEVVPGKKSLSLPISSFIDEESILIDLKSNDKKQVINELVQYAEDRKLIANRNLFLRELEEREKIASTGVGRGFAIPHIRNPRAELITKTQIIIGASSEGIDFSSPDGFPVHLFFLILAESETLHLKILSRLSYVLRRENAIDLLSRCSTKEEIIRFL